MGANGSQGPWRILNVDDYTPARYARTKVLQQAGFSVAEAGTGQDALKAIAENRPSMILLDVNLPDMTGFEVCSRIRSDPKTTAITILHISASNIDQEHQVSGLEGGADGYLVEPIDPSVLVATIRAYLRVRMAEDALRRSNAELESFAYRAAHDLNEPLRAITIHAQLLEAEMKRSGGGSGGESIRFILQASERMGSLIDGLLRYAESAHVDDVADGVVDCEALLARVLSNLDAAIRESGARVTHDPLPEVVASGGIEEVFQNLIGNAIKYRRPGVVPAIHVAARAKADSWMFSVRDNGIGIAPEHKDKIFEIFNRLHGREIPGNGLGLALCKKIVEGQGGGIWVESEPDGGSTFYFTISQKRGAPSVFSAS